MSTAIAVKNLTKRYGDIEAVAGIDLEVASGEIFALLGPNGAGKTTTVEILEGHRQRTSGEVSVLGFDPGSGEREFRKRIGIVLQETGVERFLTVAEIIAMYSGYYADPLPVDEVIDLVGLSDKRDTRVYKLSGGQTRRLDVAVGLAGNPDLLFLDEPTTGFDPSARRNAWGMIEGLRSLGKTVFLTTHYMDEAAHLADRVAIIVAGRIVALGPPGELLASDSMRTRISFLLPDDAPALPDRLSVTETGHRVSIDSEDPTRDLNILTTWALDNGISLGDLKVAKPSLEDVYLQLTGVEHE